MGFTIDEACFGSLDDFIAPRTSEYDFDIPDWGGVDASMDNLTDVI